MKKYELMYILRTNLDETARKAEIEKLHGLLIAGGAKINKVDEWGIRDLAYEIKKESKGYYVVVKFEAEGTAFKEFERLTKIDVNVLRFLIVVDKQ
ncbi:MAG TPA: 30S ribosomal protein S6 [Candidatus Onthovivens sp.]|nr:30S ribosomal protein S6 [Candidatus Onthovivens sp.]